MRIGPFPLTSMIPRSSKSKWWARRTYARSVTWISPAIPCDSIRAAVFTESPHRS